MDEVWRAAIFVLGVAIVIAALAFAVRSKFKSSQPAVEGSYGKWFFKLNDANVAILVVGVVVATVPI